MFSRLWPLSVIVVAGCAPEVRFCNSDRECFNLEVCAQGACAPIVEGADLRARDDERVGEGNAVPPEAPPGDAHDEENQPPSITPIVERVRAGLPSTIARVTDPDDEGVDVVIITPPQHGALDGLEYTGDTDFAGRDVVTIAPVDERGLAGEPVEIAIEVLPADWIDEDLLSRARVQIAPQNGVTAVTADVAVLVELLQADLGAQFLDDARHVVRFIDADGSVLPAELDDDDGARIAYWVRPADVDARPGADDFFHVYAGGATSLPAPLASEVWSTYFAVWHFVDGRDATQVDSARGYPALNQNHSADPARCRIGSCMSFDGDYDRMRMITPFFELGSAQQVTLSTSLSLRTAKVGVVIGFAKGDTNGAERLRYGVLANGAPALRYSLVDDYTDGLDHQLGPPLALGVEHRLDAVLDLQSGSITSYIDGEMVGAHTVPTGSFPLTPSREGSLGATTDDTPYAELDGTIDEVRASASARTPDFVRVDAASRAGALTIVDAPERFPIISSQ